jgi:hypothetical protein
MIGMTDHELQEELQEIRLFLKRPRADFRTVAGIENLIEVSPTDAKKVSFSVYVQLLGLCPFLSNQYSPAATRRETLTDVLTTLKRSRRNGSRSRARKPRPFLFKLYSL